MNRIHPIALALAVLLPLAACGRNDPPPPPPAPPPAPTTADPGTTPPVVGMVGRRIQDALDAASAKLATANIPVGVRIHNGVRIDDSGTALPKAEITPQGDLLVEGKAVAVDAAQRQLLLDHRANLVAIAQAGIAIGAQGADLGMQGASLGLKAAAGALKGALSGNTEEFEKQMEAEGKRIEEQGRQLEAEADRMICARMPALLASQNALAAALPAFAPYATMDESDVKDCGSNRNADVAFDFADGADAATAQPDAGEAMDAAAEADAAAKSTSTRQ